MAEQHYPLQSSSSAQNDNTDRNFLKSHFQNSNLSPEMLNYGYSAGQQILRSQRAKYMPGLSDFWSSLKVYFAVSNSYVLKKLSIVIYPMRHQTWGRILADESVGEVRYILTT